MGIFNLLLKIFGKKAQSEALQSDVKALQERFKSLETPQFNEELQPISLERESLQLGIAAGYTGKSLRAIENSLVRIESQIPTREWFDLQFGQNLKDLIDILRQHEEKEQLRFEMLQKTLDSMRAIARTAPQPIRSQLFREIRTAESQLPLTPRMRQILQIVAEAREISYKDLANRLNLGGASGLRGLLSNMVKRTNDIERFEKDGKGWVRFIGSMDLNRFKSEVKSDESSLVDNFKLASEKD